MIFWITDKNTSITVNLHVDMKVFNKTGAKMECENLPCKTNNTNNLIFEKKTSEYILFSYITKFNGILYVIIIVPFFVGVIALYAFMNCMGSKIKKFCEKKSRDHEVYIFFFYES